MLTCDSDCRDWVKIGISVFTLVSIGLAYLTYRANSMKAREDRERERDKEFVLQFRDSLEWAYNVLTDSGQRVPPEADRLNWLTAARHIIRAERIRSQITHSTYRTIADEVEEFWRQKFNVALSHQFLLSERYYMDKKHRFDPVNIHVVSALVVVGFSNWKDGEPDPLDSLDRIELIKRGGLKGGAGGGLRRYIKALDDLRAARDAQTATPESTQSS